MEGSWRNSGEGGAVKQEKRVESSGDEEGLKEEIDLKENNLCSAKAAVDEVREENQKLKRRLNQILKDYQTLQIQFNDIVSQEGYELDKNTAYIPNQETELVSLTLGRTSTESKKDEKMGNKSGADKQDKEGLPLGLDWKFENSIDSSSKTSPENSVVELTEETGERSPQNVPQKTMRSEDDEVSQQNPTKRARVSVRIRCDTPTMNDGCQWRKYGQKISKGNPCPRAYYRCTVAPSCPVRKQVQRCVEDMTILITTYEGTHNHPLPVSATGMASTTSAAASMLLSGSSTSGTILNTSFNTTTSALHGLNFNLSDNSKPKQFYLPHSSTYASPSHPTITLDLTSSCSSSQFSKMSSNLYPIPRYSSTNLNFSSLESNPAAFAWSGIQSYFKNNQVGNSLNFFGRQPPQENYYQSIMKKANPNPPQQTLPSDSIAAATKAITSDPSFQSALATALTSIMGNNGNQSGNSFKL